MPVRPADENDLAFIRMVWQHPDIERWIHDDNTAQLHIDETIRRTVAFGVFLIPLSDDGERMGIYYIVPWNSVCWEVHTAILPKFRGRQAIKTAKEGLVWFMTNTPAQKIVTHVPVDNIKAYAFAVRTGMKKIGINEKSFLRNGILVDQYIFGITKEEVLCQSQRQ